MFKYLMNLIVYMKNVSFKIISMMLLATLVVIGTASATAPSSPVTLEFIDGECSLDVWTYGNHNRITSGFESYFSSITVGGLWTNADGRLAVLDENGYMLIETKDPTECFCIVFASDRNDGFAKVYVDGNVAWVGDTWANVPLAQPIGSQTIRSLKITGLESTTHEIKISNLDVANNFHDGHVTIYKYGYQCPENSEIPEFPTIALPMVATIGMAFFFQRRRE